MAKRHKKQHFVAVSYLKSWCDPEAPHGYSPYVWLFDKDGSKPRRKAPGNIFHETDTYTIEIPDGTRNLRLEHGLQELEDKFVRIRNSKLNFRRPLTPLERVFLCAFVAATQCRTPQFREHWREQWSRPLRKMEEMMAWAKTATAEEKRRAAARFPGSSSQNNRILEYEHVKLLHEKPLQTLLVPAIQAGTPLLCRMDVAIFETDDRLGFITSDHPCVWFDPEAYKRPPIFRSPGLRSKTIEVSLPMSPRHCIVLNRLGLNGYIKADPGVLDELNKRTRFWAAKYFVARFNETRPAWFDL